MRETRQLPTFWLVTPTPASRVISGRQPASASTASNTRGGAKSEPVAALLRLDGGSKPVHVGIVVSSAGRSLRWTGHANRDFRRAWVVTHTFKQWIMAIVVGAAICRGLWRSSATLLVHRRLFDARIRKTSSLGPIIAIRLLLCAAMTRCGLMTTIFVTIGHLMAMKWPGS